jgi:4,5-dihydroxyphthalate decarboxylase
VLADANARQRAWHAKTGFFPILHLIAIREEALKARPELGEELCRAYDESKAMAYRVLQDERMSSLPFMRGYLDDAVAAGGEDPWPYGMERNRGELDRFLELARHDGLTARRLQVHELFDERAAGFRFESAMVQGCITGMADGGWAPEPTPP